MRVVVDHPGHQHPHMFRRTALEIVAMRKTIVISLQRLAGPM
jgi:hypothetical protein